MNFLIFAIDHGWQSVPHGPEPPDIAAAKTRFGNVLVQIITDRGINLICEESDPCRLSIAQKIAFERNPRIAWRNINMSAQERLEAGIWEALLHRPADTIEESPGYYRTVDHRIPEDAVREEFFAKESIRAANAERAKDILILCGDMHTDFLKAIFERNKYQAEANHSLIPKKYWQ